jgi:hypothetical protein
MGHSRREIKARDKQWRVHKRWEQDTFGFFDPTG